jgi:hypothetical protein
MLQKLSAWLYQVSNGWVALAALVIFLLFTALVLPGQASKAEAYTGDSRSPDLSFYYTADDLYQMAGAFGEAGRTAYIKARFTFDLVFPLAYTLFLATGIRWVYKRAFPTGSFWPRANIVPVFGALFDYLENLSTSLVMVRYPSPTPIADWLAAVFTLVKWILVSGSFLLLFIGIAAAVWRWRGVEVDK